MLTSVILLIILTVAFILCLTLAIVFLLTPPGNGEKSVSINLPDGTVKNVETDKGEIRIEFSYGPDGFRQADSVLFPKLQLDEDDAKSGEIDKDFLWKVRNLDNLEQMERFNVLQTLNRYGFIHQDDIPEMVKEFGAGSHKGPSPRKEEKQEPSSPSSPGDESQDDAPSVKGEDDYDKFSSESSRNVGSDYGSDSGRDFDE